MFLPRGNESKLFNSGRQSNRGSSACTWSPGGISGKAYESLELLGDIDFRGSDVEGVGDTRVGSQGGCLAYIYLQSELCLRTWITNTKDSFLLSFTS